MVGSNAFKVGKQPCSKFDGQIENLEPFMVMTDVSI